MEKSTLLLLNMHSIYDFSILEPQRGESFVENNRSLFFFKPQLLIPTTVGSGDMFVESNWVFFQSCSAVCLQNLNVSHRWRCVVNKYPLFYKRFVALPLGNNNNIC
jgi:ribosomal protein L24E